MTINVLSQNLNESNINKLQENIDLYKSLIFFEKLKKDKINTKNLDEQITLNKEKFEKVRNLKIDFSKKVKLTEQPIDAIDLIKNIKV